MTTPFVGPSYNLDSRPASVQRTVNLVPVPLEPGNERTGWVFKDAPGLSSFIPGANSTTQLASTALDPFQTGIWAAYGITRLFTFYQGPLFRVAKSSNTTTQTDIGYDSNGNMDAAALSSFLGADTGYIVTLYDQTNNGHHSSPPAPSAADTVSSSGFYFIGAASGMTTAAKCDAVPAFTVFMRCTPTITTGLEYFFILGESVSNTDIGGWFGFNASTSKLVSLLADDTSDQANYGFGSITTATNYKFGVRWDRSQASSAAKQTAIVNGSFPTRTNAPEAPATGTLGANFAARYWHLGGNRASSDFQMTVTTFLIYQASKSDADMTSIAALLP